LGSAGEVPTGYFVSYFLGYFRVIAPTAADRVKSLEKRREKPLTEGASGW
jgi:hypothetical protein